MPFFFNPFMKHDVSDFPDVYVPLDRFQRDPSVVAAHDEKSGPVAEGEKGVEAATNPKTDYGANAVEGLRAEIDLDVAVSGMNSEYDRKSKVINKAIQDIGMGTYQWKLFCLCGFGWLADNMWLQGVALTLPQLTSEFGPTSIQVRYTTCATFIGLCIGASFWGIASDIIGRRLAFNMTLLIAGIFGLAVGGGNSWIGVCGLYAALGVGVGGNLPVDGALFLEFIPFNLWANSSTFDLESGNLLTLLSIWWPVGQLIGSLVAWGFIPNYSCDPNILSCNVSPPGEVCCHKAQSKGWRYFNITLGAITLLMFVCRFFFFHLYESPKFLLSRGRQAEAVATVHGIAYSNGRKTWLTEDILNEIGGVPEGGTQIKLSRSEVFRRFLSQFSKDRIAPLFATKRIGIMTALVWFCWSTIGMGYPLFNAFLPQYLQNAGKHGGFTPTSVVYRNYAITSIVGIPGSILGAYTVDVKYIGRKYTIAISTLMTGIFLFVFTTSANSSFQLAITCMEAFFQNIMYGVLYAYTPEIFPAPNRGTGTGIASCLNRISGLFAPIVAVHAGNVNPAAPVYASGGLILAAFVAMLLFPIETRGKQSL